MSGSSRCPDERVLRELIAGRVWAFEARLIREHIKSCSRCHDFVDELEKTWRDEHLAPIQDAVTDVDSTMSTSAASAASITSKLPVPDAVPGVEPPGDDEEQVDLSFLSPTFQSWSMGRIGIYEVIGVLGQGGMGIVLKAFDSALHRMVAVKVLNPALASSSKALKRFHRGAQAAAMISHPNVVTIHAVSDPEESPPYLVMEYVRGGTLRDRIKADPLLEPIEIIRIAIQVAEGLQDAHLQGVIHRDVKPANILLEDGIARVKITDFGLALVAMSLPEMTSIGKIVGTPSYMSPEQVSSSHVDSRSDLFSLGCVMYAMVSGHSPFKGGHPLEVIRKVSDYHPIPPNELNPNCSLALSQIIMRLLEKEPEKRFLSAAELAETCAELYVIQAGRSGETTPPQPIQAFDPSAEVDGERTTEPEMQAGEVAEVCRQKPRRSLFTSKRATLFSTMAGAALVLLTIGSDLPARFMSQASSLIVNTLVAPPSDPVPIDRAPKSVVRTVSQRPGAAQYRTISAALKVARPGDLIRIIDSAIYEEHIVLDKPERWKDITIEAAPLTKPTLMRAGTENTIFEIHNTPGIVLKGLQFRTQVKQFAIHVTGDCEGLTIQGVDCSSPVGSPWALVFITCQAKGSTNRPIRVVDSVFRPDGLLGVVIQGAAGDPVVNIEVENNRFFGHGELLQVLQTVYNIKVCHNILVGGQGLTLNLRGPWESRYVEVFNNTFLESIFWLHPAQSDSSLSGISIFNNALIACNRVDVGDYGHLSDMNRGKWVFHHNIWEPGTEPDAGNAYPLVDERVDTQIELISRDPNHPDFLRPTPESKLTGKGLGGDYPNYVGALAPATPVRITSRKPF